MYVTYKKSSVNIGMTDNTGEREHSTVHKVATTMRKIYKAQ